MAAPLCNREAANGNESREGICMIAPVNAIRKKPAQPACSPMNFDILSGGSKPNSNPIKIMIINTIGSILKNDVTATARAFFVLVLSLKKETMRHSKTKLFMNIAVGLNIKPFCCLDFYSTPMTRLIQITLYSILCNSITIDSFIFSIFSNCSCFAKRHYSTFRRCQHRLLKPLMKSLQFVPVFQE